MAYRRYNRYSRRSTYRRRRNYRKRPTSFMSKAGKLAYQASQAYKLAQFAVSMLNVEKKWKENQTGAISLAAPTAATEPIINVTALAQGDTAGNRDGAKIRLKSIAMRGVLSWNSTAAAPQRVRFILIKSKVMDGTYPTLDHLLNSATDFDSFRLLDESLNNKVVFDKFYTLSDQKPEAQINWYLKMSDVVKYIGTSADEASSGWGTYLLYAVTDQTTANFPTLNLKSRIRFIDN